MADIAIYEPLYQDGQELAEAAFRPLLLSGNPFATTREFGILVHMYRLGLHKQQRLTGLLSPKFRMKTGLSGEDAIRFIKERPDADAYLFNPGPYFIYLTYNGWTQGDLVHAGLVERATKLFRASGIDWDLRNMPRQSGQVLCYSNYWVATERVWEEFVGGILCKVADFLEQNPDSPVVGEVLDKVYHYDPSPYLPFITERMISSYLSLADVRTAPYLLDPVERCWNDQLAESVRFLRARVDRADREGHFPEELRAVMHMIYRMNRKYGLTIMAHHPHPHTGRPLPRETIERGLRELDSIPLEVLR